MNTSNEKYRLLSGNALKIIAMVAMLLDHIGAVLLEKGLLPYINNAIFSGNNTNYTLNDYQTYTTLNICLRTMGRIAFPIFLFLLVEGFLHTRDPFKYAFRLFIFALISEVPFDLAVNNSILEMGHQNVFFTLTISLLMFIGMELTDQYLEKQWSNTLVKAGVILAALIAAEVLRSDYSSLGVAMALFMYFFRYDRKRMIQSLAIVIGAYTILNVMSASLSFSNIAEIFALLAFFPLALYNGERGSFRFKYVFYIFYPAHLLILAVIRLMLF